KSPATKIEKIRGFQTVGIFQNTAVLDIGKSKCFNGPVLSFLSVKHCIFAHIYFRFAIMGKCFKILYIFLHLIFTVIGDSKSGIIKVFGIKYLYFSVNFLKEPDVTIGGVHGVVSPFIKHHASSFWI